MDDEVSRQALRLALGAELTHRAGRISGGRIAAGADLRGARVRATGDRPRRSSARHRLRFDPAFPGVTGGVEELRGARRIVLACTAHDAAGAPAAVVFTTLIGAVPPQVSGGARRRADPGGLDRARAGVGVPRD